MRLWFALGPALVASRRKSFPRTRRKVASRLSLLGGLYRFVGMPEVKAPDSRHFFAAAVFENDDLNEVRTLRHPPASTQFCLRPIPLFRGVCISIPLQTLRECTAGMRARTTTYGCTATPRCGGGGGQVSRSLL